MPLHAEGKILSCQELSQTMSAFNPSSGQYVCDIWKMFHLHYTVVRIQRSATSGPTLFELYRSSYIYKMKALILYIPETKIAKFANSVGLDEVAQNEPPHLDLHCLPSSL